MLHNNGNGSNGKGTVNSKGVVNGKGNAKNTPVNAAIKQVTQQGTNALTPTGYILVKPSNATHIATPTAQGNATKATTLILQLLPLTNNACLSTTQVQQVQQLLLQAGYIMQQAQGTPVNKARIVPTYVNAANAKINA
jgi:hypothetical protein